MHLVKKWHRSKKMVLGKSQKSEIWRRCKCQNVKVEKRLAREKNQDLVTKSAQIQLRTSRLQFLTRVGRKFLTKGETQVKKKLPHAGWYFPEPTVLSSEGPFEEGGVKFRFQPTGVVLQPSIIHFSILENAVLSAHSFYFATES